MGVFFDTDAAPSRTVVASAIKDALETDPATVPDTDGAAQAKANEVVAAEHTKFHTDRFIGALVILAAVAGTAIGTEAAGLPTATRALWGFGATIFGVVAGLLGGEKAS